MSAKKGLGKGFGSLLQNDFDKSLLLDSKDRTQKLFINEIIPNPEQPRKNFDKFSLEELASSIKRFGILQPLVVTPKGDNSYIIIAGERRFRAAQLAGLKEVPALVRNSQELERLEIGLVENVQRVDLSPLEQALSIEQLHEQFNIAYEEIAQRLGKANSTILNIVRLLQLPQEAKDALNEGTISEGHARSILALREFPDEQIKLLHFIIQDKWSVRTSESYANQIKSGKSPKQKRIISSRDNNLSQKLSGYFGSKVAINRGSRGGKIQIAFSSDKELNDITKKMIG